MVSNALVMPTIAPVTPVRRRPTERFTFVAKSSTMPTAKLRDELSPEAHVNKPEAFVKFTPAMAAFGPEMKVA